MPHILIVATWFGGSVSGYNYILQEFSSRENALQAAAAIDALGVDGYYKPKTTVVPK